MLLCSSHPLGNHHDMWIHKEEHQTGAKQDRMSFNKENDISRYMKMVDRSHKGDHSSEQYINSRDRG